MQLVCSRLQKISPVDVNCEVSDTLEQSRSHFDLHSYIKGVCYKTFCNYIQLQGTDIISSMPNMNLDSNNYLRESKWATTLIHNTTFEQKYCIFCSLVCLGLVFIAGLPILKPWHWQLHVTLHLASN